MAESFKRLGAADLTGTGAVDIYTLPDTTTEAQFSITVTNYSATSASTCNLCIRPHGILVI